MDNILLISLVCFLVVIFGIALWSNYQVKNDEDFLVGGRNFNLWLTTFCLFATWFGAGTLITATDEIAREGLRAAALEPYGAGFCLIFAGLFLAKPLWEMKLYTMSDFYKQKFGTKVELITVFANIPIYVGWIAVQLISLAHMLHSFFGWSLFASVLGIAVLSMVLTLTGGLLSVSLTDSFQLILIIVGLTIMFYNVFSGFGDGNFFIGFEKLWSQVAEHKKVLIPIKNSKEFFNWLSVFVVASLGNLTGQDLGQRIFAAKSVRVAQIGCLLAGLGYLVIGSMPAILGVISVKLIGHEVPSIIPYLAKNYLSTGVRIVFIIAIFSAVLSTITSAILAPASILSHNFLVERYPKVRPIKLSRYSVFLTTALSVIVALLGEDIYGILEVSYALGLVCFFAPMLIGLYFQDKLDEMSCIYSMIISLVIWLLEFAIGGHFPYALTATAAGFASYFVFYKYRTAAN